MQSHIIFILQYYFTTKLCSFTKAGFPLGGILRAERNFSLSCDFSGGTN
jgi:hypothetical protein